MNEGISLVLRLQPLMSCCLWSILGFKLVFLITIGDSMLFAGLLMSHLKLVANIEEVKVNPALGSFDG